MDVWLASVVILVLSKLGLLCRTREWGHVEQLDLFLTCQALRAACECKGSCFLQAGPWCDSQTVAACLPRHQKEQERKAQRTAGTSQYSAAESQPHRSCLVCYVVLYVCRLPNCVCNKRIRFSCMYSISDTPDYLSYSHVNNVLAYQITFISPDYINFTVLTSMWWRQFVFGAFFCFTPAKNDGKLAAFVINWLAYYNVKPTGVLKMKRACRRTCLVH